MLIFIIKVPPIPRRPVRPIILTVFGFQRVLYVTIHVYNYKFGYGCVHTYTHTQTHRKYHSYYKYILIFTRTHAPTRAVISGSRGEYFRSLGFLGSCVPRFRKSIIVFPVNALCGIIYDSIKL
jgi:hypothetical protein